MSTSVEVAARVVIPAHNAESFLAETLESLVAQRDAPTFEVVVVLSACGDRSEDVVDTFADRLPLRVVTTLRPGGNVARNLGAAQPPQPNAVLFLDHDDVAEPDWVREMVAALNDTDIALGRYKVDLLNSPETLALRGEVFTHGPNFEPGNLNAQGGNSAYRAAAWRRLGGLGEDQHYVDDAEILWRAQDLGLSLAYVPGAVIQYRLRSSAREYFWQYVHRHEGWAHLHALYPERVPRRTTLMAVKQITWLLMHVRRSWSRDAAVKGSWVKPAARVVGSIRGSIRDRTYFP